MPSATQALEEATLLSKKDVSASESCADTDSAGSSTYIILSLKIVVSLISTRIESWLESIGRDDAQPATTIKINNIAIYFMIVSLSFAHYMTYYKGPDLSALQRIYG